MPAVPWINHSWLYSWILYVLYSLDETSGAWPVVFKALCVLALASVLLLIRPRNRFGWVGTLGVLLVMVVASLGFTLQPMVISLLFLGVTLLVLVRAGVLAACGLAQKNRRLRLGARRQARDAKPQAASRASLAAAAAVRPVDQPGRLVHPRAAGAGRVRRGCARPAFQRTGNERLSPHAAAGPGRRADRLPGESAPRLRPVQSAARVGLSARLGRQCLT